VSVHYESISEARSHLKSLVDAAGQGLPATLRRDRDQVAIVDVARYRRLLEEAVNRRAEVVPEQDGWSVFLPGLPVAADGSSFDEAVDEMVDALREYAADWQDHLRTAHNHRDNWGLVQLIGLSNDEQLRAWLAGAEQ